MDNQQNTAVMLIYLFLRHSKSGWSLSLVEWGTLIYMYRLLPHCAVLLYHTCGTTVPHCAVLPYRTVQHGGQWTIENHPAKCAIERGCGPQLILPHSAVWELCAAHPAAQAQGHHYLIMIPHYNTPFPQDVYPTRPTRNRQLYINPIIHYL